jgi:type II secretory pathway component GspD/PulD (secretin)
MTTAGFAGTPQTGVDGLFLGWGTQDFTSALETMEGVSELNTLAAPRVLAVDGAEAEIIIGDQLGFSVVTTVDNTVIQSVQFLDTGAQLRLTPTITSDGNILMEIHPELSDGQIQEGLPSKTTTEVGSHVLVRDGETIFIGGLIRERKEETRKGIPLLMHLPLLGHLFGRTTLTSQKSEIVVLITPKIVRPGDASPRWDTGLIPARWRSSPLASRDRTGTEGP